MTDTKAQLFQQRLKQLREQKGVRRITVSELCGLYPDAIGRYERGESKPTMSALIKIADYFGVSLDYLTGRTDFK